MTARLMVREVGQREFLTHVPDFSDDEYPHDRMTASDGPFFTGIDKAEAEGLRLCAEGNVEAFQVWSLVTTKQRVWALEEVEA